MLLCAAIQSDLTVEVTYYGEMTQVDTVNLLLGSRAHVHSLEVSLIYEPHSVYGNIEEKWLIQKQISWKHERHNS